MNVERVTSLKRCIVTSLHRWATGTVCLLLLISTSATAQTDTNAAAKQTVQFLDGSALRGQLQSVDRSSGIQWSHPEARNPIPFQPTNIEEIRFEPKGTAGSIDAPCRFRFANGDDLFGTFTAMTEDTVTMDTRFGKNLKVPRSTIDSISFLAKAFTVLYEGPTSITGWNLGRGNVAWKYRDGALVTEGVGTIGRNFNLPNASSLEFDLAWTGQLGLIIQFYTENIERFDYSTGSYMFYLNPNTIGVQRVSPEMGIANLGRQATLPDSKRKNALHLEIRANKEEATLAAYANGVLLQKWKDDGGFAAKGSGILFFAQHEGSTIKLSNVKVSEWDGKFEEPERIAEDAKQDFLRLANRDKVAGNLGNLQNGKLKFSSGDTPKPLEIPLERVTEIIFARAVTNQIERDPWEIRAMVSGGEKLTFDLQKWDTTEIVGTNRSFGRIALDPQTIRLVQFNLDKRKTPASQKADDWDDITTVSAIPVTERSDAVIFRSGDILSGNLQAFDPSGTMRWSRNDVAAPIEFISTNVAEIFCKQPSRNVSPSDCQVHLSNNDRLDGRLTAIDAETLNLETPYAGNLSLTRKNVQMIVPMQQNRSPIFEGPTGTDGWSMGKVTAVEDAGVWEYKNGAFYATKSASIARDLKLPDSASIQFDLAWKGTLHMAVALYTSRMDPINLNTKDSEPDFGGFYSLQLGSFGSGLLMVKKDAPLNYLWGPQMAVPALSQKAQARIEVRVDKAKNTIALLIDGSVVKQVVDMDGFAGSGTALRLVHQGLGSLRLSNLRVLEWDGQFDEAFSNLNSKDDVAKLRNRDKVSGDFQTLRNGNAVIASDAGKLEIPWERVKQIEMAGKEVEPLRSDKFNAIGYFQSGASFHFEITKWDEKGITLKSPAIGEATFSPSAFTRIRFANMKAAEPMPQPR
jgi:small nuclear ribonucleoprotein (snRNP)-like protein